MTKGCKIWLWIVLIANALAALMGMAIMSTSPSTGLWTIIAEAIVITGVCLMLFKQNRMGFYIMCATGFATLCYNLANGINPVFAILSAVISPVITYYFISKSGMINLDFSSGVSGVIQDIVDAFRGKENQFTQSTQSDSKSATAGSSVYTSQASSTTDTFTSSRQTTSNSKVNVSVDLYEELGIDRSLDCDTIRKGLRQKQKEWIPRQSACNDKEQLLFITKILDNIEDAFRFLTKESKRKAYDIALEQAYKVGRIINKAKAHLVTALDKAKAYYRQGNIKFATEYAQEAVDGDIIDVDAYDLLARCYYDSGEYARAVSVVDKGLGIFKENVHLAWLGARICTVGLKDFDGAQTRINRLIEMAPDNSIGYSEQVYMHLRKGDEKLAFQEIDAYVASHPDDSGYKKYVAYDLDDYSNCCFYHEEATDSYFIVDKESYDKCVRLRKKAFNLFNDEYTQDRLARAEYYGQKEFNDWNVESIKGLAAFGAIFTLLGFASEAFMIIALLLFIAMGGLIYYSFRPYWQINQTYVTGKMGTGEMIAHKAGPGLVEGARLILQFVIKATIYIIRFALWIATGGFFR